MPIRKSTVIWRFALAYKNASVSAYRETRIKTASPGQLIIMLYDEAVKRLDHSLDLMGRNEGSRPDPRTIETIGKGIMKTQEIITELMVSLDFDQGGEIAKNLFALYTWFNQQLLEANISHDTRKILGVRNHINELRGAWTEIVAKNAADVRGRAEVGVNIAG
jgi:flagellar protein FliS